MDQSPELLAAHQARRDACDRLLAPSAPLPGPQASDVVLSCPGGVALVRNTETDPEAFLFSFGAAYESRLAPKVEGPKAFARLLDLWAAERCYRPGPDSVATITWPSRDTEVTRALVERGFAPQTVFAVRLAGRPVTGADDPGVTVRRFEQRDVEAVVDLWIEQVLWDARFGVAAVRPSTRPRIEEQVALAVAGEEKWGWVAERDGVVVGLVVVQPPGYSDWAAHTVRVAPAAYLTCGVVAVGERGAGVGAALARCVHTDLDAAGIGATLLHYTAANPLSGPFWSRCGYRPLQTVWGRGTVG
ncbi:GNAT family N-acetyltransferase [Catenulispora subtropica]